MTQSSAARPDRVSNRAIAPGIKLMNDETANYDIKTAENAIWRHFTGEPYKNKMPVSAD
jgi:hypothetical protein